jgi:hypothetical protein
MAGKPAAKAMALLQAASKILVSRVIYSPLLEAIPGKTTQARRIQVAIKNRYQCDITLKFYI